VAQHLQNLGPFQLEGMSLLEACHNVFKVINRLVDNMRCEDCIKETVKDLSKAAAAAQSKFTAKQYQVSMTLLISHFGSL